jgi:hypothetical protein
VLDFFPQSASFKFVAGFVDVSIAGVTFYGGGVLYNAAYNTSSTPDSRIGWLVGGYGVAGDCSIWVESQWNLSSQIYTVWAYGYDSMILDPVLRYRRMQMVQAGHHTGDCDVLFLQPWMVRS